MAGDGFTIHESRITNQTLKGFNISARRAPPWVKSVGSADLHAMKMTSGLLHRLRSNTAGAKMLRITNHESRVTNHNLILMPFSFISVAIIFSCSSASLSSSLLSSRSS